MGVGGFHGACLRGTRSAWKRVTWVSAAGGAGGPRRRASESLKVLRPRTSRLDPDDKRTLGIELVEKSNNGNGDEAELGRMLHSRGKRAMTAFEEGEETDDEDEDEENAGLSMIQSKRLQMVAMPKRSDITKRQFFSRRP